ncbi:U-scoloptoxin(19)-Tl1a-like isoform X1 [Macrobrachium rosenbergii]|uniref:U-scoloptoxin(19)-Tl1a-like isoform X1 n=1 Tax=Macrobrachium rosenbergii TaxID=79674 RepID=UPI0034D4855C
MNRLGNMMVKLLSLSVFLVLILECSGDPVASITAEGDASDDSSRRQIFPENLCSRKGGICGLESFCPPKDQFAEKGLCPKQQNKGVECCKTVPLNIKNCQKRGGECMPKNQCGRAPTEPLGQCPANEVCCIML